MKVAICFRQGNGSHRYLHIARTAPKNPNDPGPIWFKDYRAAHGFKTHESAQAYLDTLPEEYKNFSGPWLGKCGQPFITTEDLP